ncbi:hypothetical protein ON010_g3327 [Phytophthora cinnamomi]|nr:hypothetical protein ON010_g3327 [Phytophthora cinnamomi]
MSRSCSLSIWPRRRHARLAARTTDRSASNALDRRDQPNYSSSVADTQQAWLTAADAGDLPALHVCAWRSHRELAVFLLARGADVAPLDEVGDAAVIGARTALTGSVDCVPGGHDGAANGIAAPPH